MGGGGGEESEEFHYVVIKFAWSPISLCVIFLILPHYWRSIFFDFPFIPCWRRLIPLSFSLKTLWSSPNPTLPPSIPQATSNSWFPNPGGHKNIERETIELRDWIPIQVLPQFDSFCLEVSRLPGVCVCVCHVYVPRLLDVFLEKMGRAHKQISGHRISYFKVFPRSSKILREHSILSRNEGLCGILNARAI